MAVLFFLIFLFGGAHMTGIIAQRKGHGYWPWAIAALLMMIIALPVVLLMKPTDAATCPHCRSQVALGATVCAKCARDITFPAPIEQHRHA